MLGEAIGAAPKGYQEGGRYATEMQQKQQALEKGQREAGRDIAYGDTNAKTESEQGQASLAGTKAGTAATEESTHRAQALLPGELKAQGQQQDVAQLTKTQMQLANKNQGIVNTNLEDETAKNSIAAQIGAVRMGKPPADADAAEADWVAKNGRSYTPAQVADGRRLGRDAIFRSNIVRDSALSSDPKYQVASTFKQKAAAAANTMAELKADLAEYKNNSSVFTPDSPAAQQAQQRIESKLALLEQSKLLSNVQMNSLRRALQPGQSWTTSGALEESVSSAAHMLQASLVRESDMLAANPHITPGERQQYLQQIMFDPNAPAVQVNPAAKFAAPAPAPNGMMPVGQQPSGPPDLRSGRGAIPLSQPAPQGK